MRSNYPYLIGSIGPRIVKFATISCACKGEMKNIGQLVNLVNVRNKIRLKTANSLFKPNAAWCHYNI